MTVTSRAWIVCLGLLVGGTLLIALLPPAGEATPVVVSGGGGERGRPPAKARTAGEAPTTAVDRSTDAGKDEGRVAVDATAVKAGPVLRVFEAGSHRPLPGAEVFVADSQLKKLEGPGPWWEQLVRAVAPLRTDERGQVTLPPVTGRLRVVARTEGLFGARMLSAGKSELELRLEPDLEMTARVVDARGRPVSGVVVVLCADEGKKLSLHRREVITDASGLARFEHLQLYRIVDKRSKGRGVSVVRLEPALRRSLWLV